MLQYPVDDHMTEWNGLLKENATNLIQSDWDFT